MKTLLIAPLVAVALLVGAPAASVAAPPPAIVQDEGSVQEIYDFLSLCMAADILAGQSAEPSQQRTEEGTMIYNLLMQAGAAVGKSEDDMVEDVAGLAYMWQSDAELMRDTPPESLRLQCLEALRSLG